MPKDDADERTESEEDAAETDAADGAASAAEPRAGASEPATAGAGWRGGALRGASLVLLLVIVACIGGGAAAGIASLFRDEAPAPAETIVIRPTADVVVAIRDLARLEAVSFHMERVIDLTSRQARFGGIVQAEDTILLVAAADVVAGVDLARMQDGDVVIEPEARRVIVTLPPAELFSTRLDNDRTYVHRRDTDLLARRREQLETEARREAERTLRAAALEAGILARAERNAAHTVEVLVRSLGYHEVVVRFRSVE